MKISRYMYEGVRTIEVRGEQGTIFISSPGEGQALEIAWCMVGSWKQERTLLDHKRRAQNSQPAEPFKDLLVRALEIAEQWKFNSNYFYEFPEKKVEQRSGAIPWRIAYKFGSTRKAED